MNLSNQKNKMKAKTWWAIEIRCISISIFFFLTERNMMMGRKKRWATTIWIIKSNLFACDLWLSKNKSHPLFLTITHTHTHLTRKQNQEPNTLTTSWYNYIDGGRNRCEGSREFLLITKPIWVTEKTRLEHCPSVFKEPQATSEPVSLQWRTRHRVP